MSNHPEMKKSVANLLKKQNGKCNWCELPFQEGDKLENANGKTREICFPWL